MASHTPPQYRSDRWVTPGVVMVFLLVAGGLVALLIAVVGYLTVRGYDAAPILDLAAKLVTAASALGGLIFQLFNRKTSTKTEKAAGLEIPARLDVLDAKLEQALDALYEPLPAAEPSIAAAPRTGIVGHGPLPPVPPARC